MALSPGTRLGPYEILGPIGAGGMGEVYRARDPRLGREVAIKALPDAFSADPERLARFDREARALAALSHPGIAAIHGIEESDSGRFLVLEMVEGETLATRLSRGPLPVEEALTACSRIAEALEAAHERGLIHRDLKPANVMLTPDGTIKVLDFGLAKAVERETSETELSRSPTVSEPATREGAVLGTAAYMSPEQARGQPLDKRTDVWSFGCVLYEALTGRRAFGSDTLSDTITAVLSHEPDWDALPTATPSLVRSLLRRCLQKDRKRRARDLGDARIEIEEALSQPEWPQEPAAAVPSASRRLGRPGLVWGAGGALVGGLVIGLVAWGTMGALVRTAGRSRQVSRFTLTHPGSEHLTNHPGYDVSISRDGAHVFYTVGQAEGRSLYVRSLDDSEPRMLPSSDSVMNPFPSADGEWVGYWSLSEGADEGPAGRWATGADHGRPLDARRDVGS
jgi:serine/threonine protein kinase